MMIARRNQDLMPSLINELMNWNNMLGEEHTSTPKMNVTESNADFRVEMCVPGLKKEDLTINLDNNNNLVIRMVKTEEKKEDGRKYLRREFGGMQFNQTLVLPENVKKEAITAKVENGILSVTLPKLTEDEREGLMRMIEIG